MEASAVMEMEVIVEHIFDFLPVEDLKRARLVCQLWSFEGAKKLLLKTYFRVPVRFHKQYQKTKEEEEKTIFKFLHPQLNQLQHREENQLLKLRSLPNVWIYEFKDIKVLYRLGVLGGNVKTLRFPRFDESMKTGENQINLQQSFRKLLSSCLTSLSTCHFVSLSSGSVTDLPMTSFDIMHLVKLGKTHLIKSLAFFFDLDDEESVEAYEKLLETTSNDHPMALESIFLTDSINELRRERPQLFSRAIKVVNKILVSCAASLRKIDVADTFGDVIELEIPTLPKLKTLIVLLPSRNRVKFQLFPNQAEESAFPNLRSVCISIMKKDWMFRNVHDFISMADKERLIPGINPDLKFVVCKSSRILIGLKAPAFVTPEEEELEAVNSRSSKLNDDEDDKKRRIYKKTWLSVFGGLYFLLCLILFYFVYYLHNLFERPETEKEETQFYTEKEHSHFWHSAELNF